MTSPVTDQSPEERYPLHEKLRQNREVAQILADLYDKLHEKGIYLAELVHYDESNIERLVFSHMPGEEFVGFALGIDPKAFSAEKDLMLEDLRRMNEEASHGA